MWNCGGVKNGEKMQKNQRETSVGSSVFKIDELSVVESESEEHQSGRAGKP